MTEGFDLDIVILGLLAVLAVPVGLIALWVRVSGMKRDKGAMAERLAQAEARLVAVEAGTPLPWARKATVAEAAPVSDLVAASVPMSAPAPAPLSEPARVAEGAALSGGVEPRPAMRRNSCLWSWRHVV